MVFKYLQSGLISLLSIFCPVKPPKFLHAKEFGCHSCSYHHVIQLSLVTGLGYQRSSPNVTCRKELWGPLLLWSSVSPRSFSPRTKGNQKKSPLFPRSALEKGSILPPVYSQPYMLRYRAWVHRKSSYFFPRRTGKKDQTELFHCTGLSLSFVVVWVSCSSKFSARYHGTVAKAKLC